MNIPAWALDEHWAIERFPAHAAGRAAAPGEGPEPPPRSLGTRTPIKVGTHVGMVRVAGHGDACCCPGVNIDAVLRHCLVERRRQQGVPSLPQQMPQ